jgi:nucleoside-diphosphate-sugar epimerase
LQIPNVKKFKKHTGWKPKVSFRDSVQKLLNYCRENYKE